MIAFFYQLQSAVDTEQVEVVRTIGEGYKTRRKETDYVVIPDSVFCNQYVSYV